MNDLAHYMDGTDSAVVAEAAKRLDWQAFLAGQITREMYEETLAKTDKEIMEERDRYRIQENLARRQEGFEKLRALRDSWG